MAKFSDTRTGLLAPSAESSPPGRERVRRTKSSAISFYQQVMRTLADAHIPFLVGGTYAFVHYTGIARATKDLDLFLRRDSLDRAMEAIERTGYRTEITHPHFLGKAYAGSKFIDVIFSSGNGTCAVDDWWFEHAPPGSLLGLPVRFSPIEEMIWSKSYVMERERYDGHDVAHLIRVGAGWLDWSRLMTRFGGNWRVLFAHLVLFGFIYPGERDKIPAAVIEELTGRLRSDPARADTNLCRGTLLSRSQYLHDINQLGFTDARLEPFGSMTREQTDLWTKAIDDAEPPAKKPGR
jgi:hypothetical protein